MEKLAQRLIENERISGEEFARIMEGKEEEPESPVAEAEQPETPQAEIPQPEPAPQEQEQPESEETTPEE